jgi:hypothetical protein
MIAHVVLFSPKPHLLQADRRALLDALVAASADIPSIKRFRVGKRVKHWLPGYEQLMLDDYEFAAIIEFDDIGALKTYLGHSSHTVIGQHFTASASRSLAYDYELVDASEVSQLLDRVP